MTGSPAGDFTIQLGTATPCEGHCVAYLLEATIPFTWTNITAHDFLLVEADKEKKTRITLTPAYYTSIPTLVAALNHELKKKALGVEFTTSTETMRVSVDCKGNLVSGSFLHILGWPKGEILMDKQQAPRLGDVTRDVRSVFVYIDCIRPTNAGSFQVQLLKEVPIGTHKPGDVIHWRAQMPVEKHNLNTQTISQLKVSIKDIHNKVLDFKGFDVSLLLAIEHKQL